MNRDYTKYQGQTKKVPAIGELIDYEALIRGDEDGAKFDDLYVIPARMQFAPDKFFLTFRAWRSVEQFETMQQPVLEYQRKIRVFGNSYAPFYAANKATIDNIHATALGFLDLGTKFKLTEGVVDPENLIIQIRGVRKGARNQEIVETVSPDGWDKAVIDNQIFADSLIAFAWSYGKSRSKFLSKLVPVI